MPNYSEYIRSEEWRKRAKRAKRKQPLCQRCNSSYRLHTHHISYERLGEERNSDLVTLCKKCHIKEHNTPTLLFDYSGWDIDNGDVDFSKVKLSSKVIFWKGAYITDDLLLHNFLADSSRPIELLSREEFLKRLAEEKYTPVTFPN